MPNPRLLVPLAVLVVVAAGSATGAGTVGAALPTCGALSNHFDGAEATGITQTGASANIQVMDPDLCSSGGGGSPSVSTAWTLEGGASTCDGWAQVGYLHSGGNSLYGFHYDSFVQYVSQNPGNGCNGPNYTTLYYGTPTGTAATDKVVFNTDHVGTGFFELWKNSTVLASTNFDPHIWSGNWLPQFFGETLQCNSDVPGTQSNKVRFSSIQKKGGDGTWSSINDLFIVTPDCSRYHHAWATQPNSFDIWTDPLS